MAHEDERRMLAAFLDERGLRMTVSRQAVLDVFLDTEGHVSAEDLLAKARLIDPGIGQATVFRTINLLADAGIAREACADEGVRTFEHAFNHEHHDHLLCSGCGQVVEFKDEEIEAAQEAVYRRFGFRSMGHRLELLGLCPDCASEDGK